MSKKQFAMDLAKLVIVAAWADGEVQNEELNALKHLLLRTPDVTSEDWRELQIYLDHPVTDEEREALLHNMLSRITTRADKEMVVQTLRELVEADGVVTADEAALLDEVGRAVEARGTGLLGALAGLVRRAGRSLAGSTTRTVREDRLDDFVHNPIHFRVTGMAAASSRALSAGDETLRLACLAAGMLTLAGSAEGKVDARTAKAMHDELVAGFGISEPDAGLIVQVTAELVVEGLDAYRLQQSVRESFDADRRTKLLDGLFRVARESGELVPEVLDRLRRLANTLGLSRNELAAARRRAGDLSGE